MPQQLLHSDTVFVGLQADKPEEAIKKMIASLPEWSLPSKNRATVEKLLINREKFGTTAIGGGVALPHCVADISVPIASLGISREGIAFPSLDGGLVHFVYLVLVPENEESHQTLRGSLQDAEKFFRDRFLKERLRLSESPEEAYEIFVRESQYLSSSLQTV